VSRYTQSFFSLANREDENLEYFKLRDPKASNVDWKGFQFDVKNFRRFVSKRKRHAVENATYRRRLLGYEDRVEGFVEGTASDLVRRMGNNLIVKEFPTSRLTMPMLESYLETLDVQDNFQPDLLILDYIDLMKLNPDRIRIDTQQLYKELRGLGMERNMAIASVSQTNKSGEDVDLITAQYLAEDYQKSANADTIITYNQTTEEKRIGLARLLSLKSRDQRTGDIIVVSQAYNVGQFAVDAALLPYQFGYKDLIAKTVEQSSGDSGPRRRRKVRRRKLTGR
ncbi:hypothetical protein KAR91_28615, partial [Candidatus Pacearchaeota archaeon]|nr:hypothetical protein [Candidatus Pacearchaeota archaeon]